MWYGVIFLDIWFEEIFTMAFAPLEWTNHDIESVDQTF